MMALAGTIQGNTIIIDNDSITNYDGKDVILTILDHPYKADRKKINWDKYGMETERGIYIDTSPYIYYLEKNPQYSDKVKDFFYKKLLFW